jgi:hypothetical protein
MVEDDVIKTTADLAQLTFEDGDPTREVEVSFDERVNPDQSPKPHPAKKEQQLTRP